MSTSCGHSAYKNEKNRCCRIKYTNKIIHTLMLKRNKVRFLKLTVCSRSDFFAIFYFKNLINLLAVTNSISKISFPCSSNGSEIILTHNNHLHSGEKWLIVLSHYTDN